MRLLKYEKDEGPIHSLRIWEATQHRVAKAIWAGVLKTIWTELDMKFHGVLFDDSITSKCWNRLVVHTKIPLYLFLRPENTL
jgi:hypothetical protein